MMIVAVAAEKGGYGQKSGSKSVDGRVECMAKELSSIGRRCQVMAGDVFVFY